MNSSPRRSADTWVGFKTFDLSTARDRELVNLPTTTAIVPVNVDAQASFRFGQENAPAIDLRDINNMSFSEPIGQVFLDNPSASAGDTLEIILGRGGELSAERVDSNLVDIQDWSAGAIPPSANETGVATDSQTGDGSFASQAVPDGRALRIKADPANASTAFVDGFPLSGGDELVLAVDNFDVPALSFNDQTETLHGIAEA